MSRMLRLVLVCLLVVTLPVKAIAGLTMSAWAGGSPAPASMHLPAEDTAVAPHADCHGAAAADEASPQPHGPGGGKCGSCSPCSVATGPAPDVAVMLAALPAHQGLARPSVTPCGVVADVPHEPPRSRLR